MHTNRLIGEKSPYLLQHAHNPVDWRPWGEDAFEEARRRDKPIFLSIGYSTCHWCHVMERESFENESIAAILNQNFVCIKVDREERPDIDRIYMHYVQATTGGGGWPMSVWLTPALKPFVGGTYFPPEDRWGRPGFPTALHRISEAWSRDRDRIVSSSENVIEQLRSETQFSGDGGLLVSKETLDSGFYVFRRTFDSQRGGFGGAPKFPRPVTHNFLLRYYERTGNREALDMVVDTLRAMAKGGMNDQLGGGFHRYSVDANWFVPHFEKMLYDQAQLAISYLEAFQITHESDLADVARDIFEYVLRDMRDPGGAFYSAEDADSVIDPAHPHEKGEGAFYIWPRSEIEEILGKQAAEQFCYHFGVERDGNVREDPQQEFIGKNILFEAHEIEDPAVAASIARSKQKLLEARSKRVRPHLDDKVLTAWNGLMISAFAKGGAILSEPRYLDAARKAADFILHKLRNPETGALLRRYREGDAAIPGFLDDYAFFTQGLLDLYEADFHLPYLQTAIQLTEQQLDQFEDKSGGAFFSAAAGDPSLVMRLKDDYDGAEPSGNSVAALNLLRLAGMTDRHDFRDSATRLLRAFAPRAGAAPVAMPQMLCAYEFSLSKPEQVVLVFAPRDASAPKEPRPSGSGPFEPNLLDAQRNEAVVTARKQADALLRELHSRFLPHKVVLAVGDEAARAELSRYIPAIANMTALAGAATGYVCENYACQLPTSDPQEFAKLLQAP